MHFNKVVLDETNLCKIEKNTFLTSSVLDKKRSGMPQKYADVSVHLEKSVLQ